ncbi:MAG: hypothetical protein AABX30_02730 [Nanoarchaeota archaeon]
MRESHTILVNYLRLSLYLSPKSIGAGTIGALGTSLLVPMLGVYFFPGLVLFGSASSLVKIISKKFN